MYDRFVEQVATVAAVGFTNDELLYIVDVMNGVTIGFDSDWGFSKDSRKAFVITYNVEKAFNEDPGLYQEKWGINQEEFLSKFHSLTEASRATLAIWSKLLWDHGHWSEMVQVS